MMENIGKMKVGSTEFAMQLLKEKHCKSALKGYDFFTSGYVQYL